MPRRIICRKFFLYMGLLLILLAASIVGIYFYSPSGYLLIDLISGLAWRRTYTSPRQHQSYQAKGGRQGK